jgi:hypothetical protein
VFQQKMIESFCFLVCIFPHAVEAGFPALSRVAKSNRASNLADQPLHPEKVKYFLGLRELANSWWSHQRTRGFL